MHAARNTLLTLALAVAAFAAREARAASGRVLRVGTSGDYAPFTLHGRGFDVDVARAWAADLGLSIEWVPFRWPDLGAMIAADRMDVAMSGITWRPERAVIGWMSRAVAWGGPCVVGDPSAGPVAVNRGGMLETWAKRRFRGSELVPFDDNLALPALLEGGAVTAFVTDSFEVAGRSTVRGAAIRCDPPRDRKVYWVAPARTADLGPRIDRWLDANERRIAGLRRRWWGDRHERDAIDDLVDRMARRFELMPAVATWKRAHGRPVEDPYREEQVVERAATRARAVGLEPAGIRSLFRLQIELAKAIERRVPDGDPSLDLDDQLRPLLLRLGDQIVQRLSTVAPIARGSLGEDRLLPLGALLTRDEVTRLEEALEAVERRRG
jgi:cyclohexadienyl dehydratase